MAKDYFQDITPPEEEPRHLQPSPAPARAASEKEEPPERGIRQINAPERRLRPRPPVNDVRDPANFGVQQLPPKPRRPRRRFGWLWVFAVILILILIGLALFALRKTTVTVTPRSHAIVFDGTEQFTAYPETSAASGTLAYTVASSNLQETAVVPAQGTHEVDTKAQGTITIYNDYSSSPVKLVATTRFETPSGLIFRIPNAVSVPGKSGSTPGHVSVTVVADQAGAQYDIGPTSRFTVPGLQSIPAMYSNVYAQSTASTTGGFSGQEPSADPSAVQSALDQIEAKLAREAKSATSTSGGSEITLPGLTQITYEELPQAADSSGGLKVGESAHIEIPEFNENALTQAIAQQVGEDAGGSKLTLVPGPGFAAQENAAASSSLGVDPIIFSLSGQATLVWQVDTAALAQALAGHDQNAFSTIESGFPGVEEANARIEPFWKNSFPSNPADIQITVLPPKTSQ